ncbi:MULTISPECIES: restriction endonuclease subunit S [Streptomyces albovinaceus subgroup]|uniref:restriction endonuclease subunit S n=1 Tax=Streptomyces albovinaceus subgroup TaxID=1482558 RepID=UPI000AEDFD59|nr:restriction endonuclease subunit S [Streptomyces mediolani]
MTVELSVLPTHWGKSRVDRVASVNARIGWKALTAAEYQPQGFTFLSTPNIKGREIDFENVNYITEFRYQESPELKLREGDVLLVKDGNTLGIVNLVKHLPRPATVNGSIAVIRPTGIDGAFLRYVLESRVTQAAINMLKGGMGVPHLFQWDINRLPAPVPPLEEQRRIADFLDAETARVDRMADIRKQQIDLLGSSEASVISDSLESTGGTPTRVKHLATKITSGPRGWGGLVTDQGSLFLRITNIPRRGITLDLEDSLYVTAPSGPERERSRTRSGDVLVSITADIGSVAIVDERAADANISQHVAMVRPDQGSCNPTWLAYAIKSARSNQFLRMNSYGGTKVGLGLGDVANLSIEIPDLMTQEQSASRITQILSQREDLRHRMIIQRALLTERRQALITAAVTGQFDVSTASGRNVTDGVSA